ncbi:MAG: hypothetical protein KIT10_09990 [Flavobacteriales bacterium]|nr:hypothetical protein [Flavobacteriales bacterium]
MKTPHILAGALLALAMPSMAAHSFPAKERTVTIDEARFHALPVEQQAEVLRIADRLETIIATDASSLTREERAAMRGEWRELKQEMKALNRGGTVIYLSTGGLILLIILLIILL